jgi:hypothetical protein
MNQHFQLQNRLEVNSYIRKIAPSVSWVIIPLTYFLFLGSAHCTSSASRDTLIPDRSYAGYRLHVSNVKVLKAKGDLITIACDLANTGKFDIELGKGSPLPYLQFIYDHSLLSNNLDLYRDQIRYNLIRLPVKVKIGQMAKAVQIKFSTSTLVPALADSQQGSNSQSSKPPKPNRSSQESSSPLRTQPADTSDEVVFETPKFESTDLDDILERKNACADLVIDTIVLLKTDGKTATFQYKLTNVGKGPADILGTSTEDSDNLAVRAFLSGSKSISKGSIVLGGDYVRSGVESTRGVLYPNQSLVETIQVDIRRKTRYMQVFILSIDAFMKLEECSRTNNTNFFQLQ